MRRAWVAAGLVVVVALATVAAQTTRQVTFAWDVTPGAPGTLAQIERDAVVIGTCAALDAPSQSERRCTVTSPTGPGTFRARMGIATGEWGPWSSTITATIPPQTGASPGAFVVGWHQVPAVSGVPVMPNPTASVIDDFNRADGAIGADWTVIAGGINVSSNTAVPVSGAFDGATYDLDTYGPTFEVGLDITTKPADGTTSVAVGALRDGTVNGYASVAVPVGGGFDTLNIERYDAGAPTVIATTTTIEVQTGDGLAYQQEGSTHRLYLRQSGVWSLILSTTDSTYTGASDNRALIVLVGGTSAIDNVFAGNRVVGGDVVTWMPRHQTAGGRRGRMVPSGMTPPTRPT